MVLIVMLGGLGAALAPTGPEGAAESIDIVLTGGVVITQDTRIRPGIYHVADANQQGAVRIVGDGITVDLQGACLAGSDDGVPPDRYDGRGVSIRGRGVTVRNARIQGYKVGLYAADSPGITVTDCDVSRNYRQRLRSTPQREDLADWLFGHENDENQWLRYGAGIYLHRCPQATISRNRARNGQNGICISQCDGSVIADNDMSFMNRRLDLAPAEGKRRRGGTGRRRTPAPRRAL